MPRQSSGNRDREVKVTFLAKTDQNSLRKLYDTARKVRREFERSLELARAAATVSFDARKGIRNLTHERAVQSLERSRTRRRLQPRPASTYSQGSSRARPRRQRTARGREPYFSPEELEAARIRVLARRARDMERLGPSLEDRVGRRPRKLLSSVRTGRLFPRPPSPYRGGTRPPQPPPIGRRSGGGQLMLPSPITGVGDFLSRRGLMGPGQIQDLLGTGLDRLPFDTFKKLSPQLEKSRNALKELSDEIRVLGNAAGRTERKIGKRAGRMAGRIDRAYDRFDLSRGISNAERGLAGLGDIAFESTEELEQNLKLLRKKHRVEKEIHTDMIRRRHGYGGVFGDTDAYDPFTPITTKHSAATLASIEAVSSGFQGLSSSLSLLSGDLEQLVYAPFFLRFSHLPTFFASAGLGAIGKLQYDLLRLGEEAKQTDIRMSHMVPKLEERNRIEDEAIAIAIRTGDSFDKLRLEMADLYSKNIIFKDETFQATLDLARANPGFGLDAVLSILQKLGNVDPARHEQLHQLGYTVRETRGDPNRIALGMRGRYVTGLDRKDHQQLFNAAISLAQQTFGGISEEMGLRTVSGQAGHLANTLRDLGRVIGTDLNTSLTALTQVLVPVAQGIRWVIRASEKLEQVVNPANVAAKAMVEIIKGLILFGSILGIKILGGILYRSLGVLLDQIRKNATASHIFGLGLKNAGNSATRAAAQFTILGRSVRVSGTALFAASTAIGYFTAQSEDAKVQTAGYIASIVLMTSSVTGFGWVTALATKAHNAFRISLVAGSVASRAGVIWNTALAASTALVAGGFTAGTVAAVAFATALAATGIGALVVLIGVGSYEIYRNWDKIVETAKKAYALYKKIPLPIKLLLGLIVPFANLVNAAYFAWMGIEKAIEAVNRHGKTMLNWMQPIYNMIKWIRDTWLQIVQFVKGGVGGGGVTVPVEPTLPMTGEGERSWADKIKDSIKIAFASWTFQLDVPVVPLGLGAGILALNNFISNNGRGWELTVNVKTTGVETAKYLLDGLLTNEEGASRTATINTSVVGAETAKYLLDGLLVNEEGLSRTATVNTVTSGIEVAKYLLDGLLVNEDGVNRAATISVGLSGVAQAQATLNSLTAPQTKTITVRTIREGAIVQQPKPKPKPQPTGTIIIPPSGDPRDPIPPIGTPQIPPTDNRYPGDLLTGGPNKVPDSRIPPTPTPRKKSLEDISREWDAQDPDIHAMFRHHYGDRAKEVWVRERHQFYKDLEPPQAFRGAYIKASMRGSLIRAGDRGRDEVITPVPRRYRYGQGGGMGGNTYNLDVSVAINAPMSGDPNSIREFARLVGNEIVSDIEDRI